MSRNRIRERLRVLALVACASILPAAASSGRVVDPKGKPVEGARVCLIAGGAEEMCVTTDAQGAYRLLDSSLTTVRIVAKGFLPKTIAAVDQEAAVVLQLAASLRARVLDAVTGKPIEKGQLRISYPTGETKGPFPTNAGGLRISSLPPGEIVPTASAAGYREGKGEPVALEGGKESEIVIKLEPEK